MTRVGRNDPCPCGSGKKYKHCHLPIDQAADAEQRALKQAQDTLYPRMVEAAQAHPEIFPDALQQFWDGRYSPEQLGELDEHEDRGGDRFLTWVVFDYLLPDGRTLATELADDPGELGLDEYEARLLQDWRDVRLRPYIVAERAKGKSLTMRDMLDDQTYQVIDHFASKRMELGEVLVGHLVPVAGSHYLAGAAAHLTADTAEKLREFAELHLEAYRREHAAATWADLLRTRSSVLNHFVMQLPREHPDMTILDNIIVQTRATLALTGASLGLVRDKDEAI